MSTRRWPSGLSREELLDCIPVEPSGATTREVWGELRHRQAFRLTARTPALSTVRNYLHNVADAHYVTRTFDRSARSYRWRRREGA